MKPEYQNWINDFVVKHGGNVKNLCTVATEEMVKSFPELRRERGWIWFEAPVDGEINDQHWWCVDVDGNIIDPTIKQYDGHIIHKYESYDEWLHGPLPTGKCYNCGEFVYDDGNFCSNECSGTTIAQLNEMRKYNGI